MPWALGVFAATAHPGKFAEAVRQSTGEEVEIPEALAAALQKPKQAVRVGKRASELAARVGVSRPTLTSLVGGLERNGLLRRSPVESDRRGIRLEPTPAGRAAVAEAEAALTARMLELIDLQTAGCVSEVVATLGAAPPPAPPRARERRGFGLRGAAPWVARHAAKHAAELRKRNAQPPPPGSARATLRVPDEAESIKANVALLHQLTTRIRSLCRRFDRKFFEIGELLATIQRQELHHAKGYSSFEAFLDREIDIGRGTALKLIRIAHEAYGTYDVARFAAESTRFIEVLSTWYVRRSRRRFYGEGWPADKRAAYATLYEVLTTLNRLVAPILELKNLVTVMKSVDMESV